jgi:transposase
MKHRFASMHEESASGRFCCKSPLLVAANSDSVALRQSAAEAGDDGRLKHEQKQLFYSFCLDDAVPDDHLVREIAAVLDLSWVHAELAPHYSKIGRPSIDPMLMIRMLIVGYVFAIRSERALCREVHVNLAYRWFCGLGIEDRVPDHSTFTRARNERFRDGDIFRRLFERVVETCIAAGLVGGKGFAVDASLIAAADANKCRSTPGDEWSHDIDPEIARRAVQDYLHISTIRLGVQPPTSHRSSSPPPIPPPNGLAPWTMSAIGGSSGHQLDALSLMTHKRQRPTAQPNV